MNLNDLKKGDIVLFENGDERKVRYISKYDSGEFNVCFWKAVLGRVQRSISWTYREDGKYDRDDLSEWANDIVKIIKKDVDTQAAAE